MAVGIVQRRIIQRDAAHVLCRGVGVSPIDIEREKILNRERSDVEGFDLHIRQSKVLPIYRESSTNITFTFTLDYLPAHRVITNITLGLFSYCAWLALPG